VFLLENGDVLEINEDSASIVDTVESGRILIDGRGIGDVGRIVLRDRHLLAQYGVLTCIVVISPDKKAILSGPTIITRGFVFVKESEDLINEAISLVDNAINDLLRDGKTGWAPLKNKMRQVLQDYLYEETGRKPMILPIIMEV